MGFLDRVLGGGGGDDPQREADIARIAAGGIPLAAEQRIRELSGAFTSGLSVSDFALARLDRVEPVCQVNGSSVYKVGWQGTPQRWSRDGLVTEQRVLTDAWNHARSLALRRLATEAQLAGAHAVVDVSFAGNRHEFFSDEIEIVVNGTAVRLPEGGGEFPILTDLAMPDYTLLRNAGYRPVGIVASTSVFYVVPTWSTRVATRSVMQPNQELTDFTQGVYAAREMALARANGQVAYFGGDGMVGMRIEHHIAAREANNRTDLIVTFHVLGTAIADAAEHRPLEPRTVVRQGAR
jgi:uncharacterized protein YbjQ (UPF0145 family)